jgi:excisionase family DNA binding protein
VKPLCPKEIAQLLGVSVRTAQRLLKTGELRAFRAGPKLLRTNQAELDRYIALRWNRPAAQ